MHVLKSPSFFAIETARFSFLVVTVLFIVVWSGSALIDDKKLLLNVSNSLRYFCSYFS